jgi:hypothetical protein
VKHHLTLTLIALSVLCALQVQAQKPLTTAEAKEHIGEKATVCGDAVSAHYAAKTRGNPTFINLDKPHPDQVFTVLIWAVIARNSAIPRMRIGTNASASPEK